MTLYTALVIVHVLLFAYWLGADWGVYVTARYVADPELSLAERRRFLRALFNIDLMPRIAFNLLLPVGVQIATFYVAWEPIQQVALAVWVGALIWLIINVQGYRKIGTPLGDRMRGYDQWIRMALVPALLGAGLVALTRGQGVVPAFVGFKLIVFATMIVVGLALRAVLRQWAIGFGRLAAEGRNAALDGLFSKSLHRAQLLAYLMWSLSAVMAVLGVSRLG